MNHKILKILGVGLTASLLVSLLGFAVPVSGSTLSWGDEDLPSTVNAILTPDEHVVDMAVNGATIYAAIAGTPGEKIFKSTNTGETWKELSAAKATTSFPSVNITLVAVAPDNPDMVAAVTETGTVEYSTNGGSSWTELDAPTATGNVYDISVSEETGGAYYIAVAGNESSLAQLWTIKLAAGEDWEQRYDTANGAKSQEAAWAVTFSPNFNTDKVIIVVTANASTDATLQVLWYESPYNWNDDATAFPTYGEGIVISTIGAALDKADVAVHPEFLASDEATRIYFVGLAASTTGGVYRIIDDYQDKEVETWTSASVGPVGSVAFDGTTLIAGDWNNNQVFADDDPMASSPRFERVTTLKQPGGTMKTVVAFSGSDVVAATQGDESAFAVSTDGGMAFNDISLIDTVLTNIRDIEPSMDNSKLYMTTDDTGASVWLYDGSWMRVGNLGATTSGYIVRVSPEDPDVVYVGELGDTKVYYSNTAGKEDWRSRPAYRLDDLVDMVVESNLIVHAIDGDEISTTTNGGSSWGSTDSLGIAANMLHQAPNGDLFVGGTDGYFAWSFDGGETWEASDETVRGEVGNIQVVTDTDYANNGVVYCATDAAGEEGVYPAKAEADTSFSSSKGYAFDNDAGVTGLGMWSGVLYVVADNGTDGFLVRSFDPAASDTHYSPATLTETDSPGEKFSAGPRALKLSATSSGPKLWAIDTSGTQGVYSFTDAIATTAPTLNSPANGASVAVNEASGESYDVSFSFDRPNSSADVAELQIATDSLFTGIIWRKADIGLWDEQQTATVTVGPNGMQGEGDALANFLPGQTYYWRVRVAADGPLYSPYTETRSFTVAEIPDAPPPVEVIQQPAPPAPVVTPEVVVEVPPPTQVNIPPAPAPPAPITPAWIYVIIAVGGVLVIAVLVLIVRTRRAP
jgi:hypothetical protein